MTTLPIPHQEKFCGYIWLYEEIARDCQSYQLFIAGIVVTSMDSIFSFMY